MRENIFIKRAKENNLKGIDVTVPRDKLVVFTGISGSGKSSLAFDTIFAEGQRRFVESLSAYARQFLGQMDKPDVEYIEGLSPAISIDQKTTSNNPRSTVGTVTEIYDYLRLLYARIGTPYCYNCGREISKQSTDQIVDKVMNGPAGSRLMVLAPVVRGRKGEYNKQLDSYKKSGFVRVIVDGITYSLDDEINLDKNQRHSISVVVDRLVIKEDIVPRLSESIEQALKLADGLVVVDCEGTETLYSNKYSCPDCDITIEELEPRMFSFNSPFGACPECHGIGYKMEFDPDLLIPNPNLTLAEGAVKVIGFNMDGGRIMEIYFKALGKHYGFDLNTPYCKLSKAATDIILYGNGGEKINMSYNSKTFNGNYQSSWEGLIPMLVRRYAESSSDYVRSEYENYMTNKECLKCGGQRLKPQSLSVKIAGMNIYELSLMPIDSLLNFFTMLKLDETKSTIAYMVLKEIKARLSFLLDVGLSYLSLSRSSGSLSGGEAQRIRLATQIGSGLMGVLYILDEPSIGLHQRDNSKLIATLTKLRDLGNTVIVVEHDEETMLSADHIIDIGPGAGILGGNLVASGTAEEIMNCPESITGQYLSGRKSIPTPENRRIPDGRELVIKGARKNNLKNVDVTIPLGVITAVTGVSGSGKSSLINEILLPFLSHKLNGSRAKKIECDEILGEEHLDKIIAIDQSPIGRTPRSNPATYTALFTQIRDLFASTTAAKEKGYTSGRFSFNVRGGRCDNCNGDGILKIEMNFLPDVYVPCEVCKGKRYNRDTLNVTYKGKNIADVLDMTVAEAVVFFENITSICGRLQTLNDVGLGYIKLGQSATTLSGGEAQRVKLATELSKRSSGKTVYLLDEPTTGLHAADVDRLVQILQRLVSTGNTVIVIEHNLDVIRIADHIIDLGPEGGNGGGEVIASGTPEEIALLPHSHTGVYLKKAFENIQVLEKKRAKEDAKESKN